MAGKKWKGIQENDVRIQGEVPTDPVSNGDYMFFKVMTSVTQVDPNGQFVDLPQAVPIMVEPGRLTNVVKTHIKAGRELLIVGQYKSWEAGGVEQHQIVARLIKLGNKPYEGKNEAEVPLPPS